MQGNGEGQRQPVSDLICVLFACICTVSRTASTIHHGPSYTRITLLHFYFHVLHDIYSTTTGVYAVPDMLHIQVTASTPSPQPEHQPSLADLSRNASVISSSSSSSSTSSLVVTTPRPRPVRTFSSPRSPSRDAPSTPRSTRPPAYLSRELGFGNGNGTESYEDMRRRAQSRSKSRARSRNSSVGLKVSADDFRFEETLGEGSYSTVRSKSLLFICSHTLLCRLSEPSTLLQSRSMLSRF